MKIELKNIPIRDVVKNYTDTAEEGVYGYGGKLNIRPKYQREFIYKEKERNAVIKTVMSGFPLNTMYWMKNEDGTFEVLDGQQRTISICQYVNKEYSVDYRGFQNLTSTEQDAILNYDLMVYICEGTDKERLDWFQTINIAGAKLTNQEIRNAIYTGPWLTDAKKWFSKNGCPASDYSKYLKGAANRQEYLETAISWIADTENKAIEEYMAEHQHDTTAVNLWNHFINVMNWVKTYFPTYRDKMKGLDWGRLYNEYKDNTYDPQQLEAEIQKLLMDEEVNNQAGIYEYLLSGKAKSKERLLSLRAFNDREKNLLYERQNHKCAKCGKVFELKDLDAHHKIEWSQGGKTTLENGVLYCKACHHIEHDNVH